MATAKMMNAKITINDNDIDPSDISLIEVTSFSDAERVFTPGIRTAKIPLLDIKINKKKCPYCDNSSGKTDERGLCISCGGALVEDAL